MHSTIVCDVWAKEKSDLKIAKSAGIARIAGIGGGERLNPLWPKAPIPRQAFVNIELSEDSLMPTGR